VTRLHHAGAPSRSQGFTLLEVLLAFIIFALSFATVLEIMSGSMRSTVRARDYSEAALLAQSLMDTVGTEFPLQDGVFQGEAGDGYRWTVDIRPFEPQTAEEDYVNQLAQNSGTLLFWVDVDLEWGAEPRAGSAHFTTIRSVLQGRDS